MNMQDQCVRQKWIFRCLFVLVFLAVSGALQGCATMLLWQESRPIHTVPAKNGCGTIVAAYCDDRCERLSIKYRAKINEQEKDFWLNMKMPPFLSLEPTINASAKGVHYSSVPPWMLGLAPAQPWEQNSGKYVPYAQLTQIENSYRPASTKRKWSLAKMHPVTPYLVSTVDSIQTENPGALGMLMCMPSTANTFLTTENAIALENNGSATGEPVQYFACFTVPSPHYPHCKTGVFIVEFPSCTHLSQGTLIALIPLTVVADIALSPLELLSYSMWAIGGAH
jgi:hypothetical protein